MALRIIYLQASLAVAVYKDKFILTFNDGLWAGWPRNLGSILHSVRTGSGAHSGSYLMGAGGHRENFAFTFINPLKHRGYYMYYIL
jgi:hypothetical protein